MTTAKLSGIAPVFIVRDVPAALAFYRDRLGFDAAHAREVTFYQPCKDDDGLRGFAVHHADGYVLFMGRPR